MKGLLDPLAAPALVCWAIGNSANHIMASMRTPAPAAMRIATPAITATPMPSRPSMNSQSAHQVPAMEWKADWKGPTLTDVKKPLVGEPPWIQAFADGVA